MRIVLPLIALMLTTAGAPAPQVDARPSMSELQAPPGPGEAVCRDRIEEIRDERGLPKLDRKAASPDEALLIAAVDQRIGGCSVMVMRNDTSDIRPLPTREGPPRVRRIPGQ
jgi:hypothetical protein